MKMFLTVNNFVLKPVVLFNVLVTTDMFLLWMERAVKVPQNSISPLIIIHSRSVLCT